MINIIRSILPKDKFTVAVSGGVDSIAAAHLLIRLYGPDRVSVCHYNHNLRQQNNLMETRVKQFCEHNYVNYSTATRERKSIKGSIEATLREDRLNFFKTLQSHIICCHHIDDAVESYVMNMLRGCPEYMPIPVSTKLESYSICRPFIRNAKAELIEYAKNNDLLDYIVEDETNVDTAYRRNWIRHDIVPQFSQFGLPKIVRKKFYNKILSSNEL